MTLVPSQSFGGGGGSGAGTEISYTQITSPAAITDTSEATATALISPGSITFDGSPVVCEFFGDVAADTGAASDLLIITLFEGSTQITRLGWLRTVVTAAASVGTMCCRYRFTPTAGAHTYKLCGFVASTSGSPQILAGSGGTAGHPPAYVRFTKV